MDNSCIQLTSCLENYTTVFVNMNRSIKIYILFLLSLPLAMQAQTADNIMWAKASLNHSINAKTSASFAPILRLNEDFTNYQNFSLDYSLKYKLNSIFSAHLIGRTWFLPGGTQRQFIWPQISAAKSFDNLNLSSYARWHKALDIDEVVDADFFRWKTSLTWSASDKLKLFTGVEPWWRLDSDVKDIQRTRYSLGAKYIISDKLSVAIDWWRQVDVNTTVNIFVPHLAYII